MLALPDFSNFTSVKRQYVVSSVMSSEEVTSEVRNDVVARQSLATKYYNSVYCSREGNQLSHSVSKPDYDTVAHGLLRSF
jgi:hypothetical protein